MTSINREFMEEHVGNIKKLLSIDEYLKDYNKANNLLVSIVAAPPSFAAGRLDLSSDYVRSKYREIAASRDRNERADEIMKAWNDANRAAEAGKKFEPHAFEVLVLGGRSHPGCAPPAAS